MVERIEARPRPPGLRAVGGRGARVRRAVPAPFVGFVGPLRRRASTCRCRTPTRASRSGWRLAADVVGAGDRHRGGGRGAARRLRTTSACRRCCRGPCRPTWPRRRSCSASGMRYDGVFDHPLAEPGDWWRPHVLYRATVDDLPAPRRTDRAGSRRDPDRRRAGRAGRAARARRRARCAASRVRAAARAGRGRPRRPRGRRRRPAAPRPHVRLPRARAAVRRRAAGHPGAGALLRHARRRLGARAHRRPPSTSDASSASPRW